MEIVGAVDKEKTSLHVLKFTRDCLSNLHNPDQTSRGGPFLPKKWVLGDHFSTENFSPGDQKFHDQNSGDSAIKKSKAKYLTPVHGLGPGQGDLNQLKSP